MAEVILGQNFTFQVLFVNEFNAPLAVLNPKITIFTYSSLGTKQVLVNGVAMTTVVGEVGRYTYLYTAGVGLGDHTAVYAEMEGTDPQNPAVRLLVEEQFQTVASTTATSLIDNTLKASFVKV